MSRGMIQIVFGQDSRFIYIVQLNQYTCIFFRLNYQRQIRFFKPRLIETAYVLKKTRFCTGWQMTLCWRGALIIVLFPPSPYRYFGSLTTSGCPIFLATLHLLEMYRNPHIKRCGTPWAVGEGYRVFVLLFFNFRHFWSFEFVLQQNKSVPGLRFFFCSVRDCGTGQWSSTPLCNSVSNFWITFVTVSVNSHFWEKNF